MFQLKLNKFILYILLSGNFLFANEIDFGAIDSISQQKDIIENTSSKDISKSAQKEEDKMYDSRKYTLNKFLTAITKKPENPVVPYESSNDSKSSNNKLSSNNKSSKLNYKESWRCKNITNSNMRKYCRAVTKHDADLCSDIYDNDMRIACRNKVSNSGCSYMKDEFKRELCKNNCSRLALFASQSKEIDDMRYMCKKDCYYIKDSNYRELCRAINN